MENVPGLGEERLIRKRVPVPRQARLGRPDGPNRVKDATKLTVLPLVGTTDVTRDDQHAESERRAAAGITAAPRTCHSGLQWLQWLQAKHIWYVTTSATPLWPGRMKSE